MAGDDAGTRIGFYGDDVTGATDSLYQFRRAGLDGILFLGVPGPSRMTSHEDKAVIGIAGVARSLDPGEMVAEIEPAFRFLAELPCRHVQYKVCSTFDSSAERGSLGVPLALARTVFGKQPVVIAPAQPQFGRYTVFGQHFATAGGPEVFRLDRHPTMSAHPATPMGEADLRRHLREQTDASVGLLDIRALRGSEEDRGRAFAEICGSGPAGVVVDALDDADMMAIGGLALDDRSNTVSIGSGGLSYGLGRAAGDAPAPDSPPIAPASPGLVLAGSLSPRTRDQIAHVVGLRWAQFPVDVTDLPGDGDPPPALLDDVLGRLAAGQSVVVSSLPPRGRVPGADSAAIARRLGRLYAALTDAAVRSRLAGRTIIAGGDTSGWTLRGLDVYGLEALGALDVAATLCSLRSDDPALDGAQVLLKGGQVGSVDLFERAVSGRRG